MCIIFIILSFLQVRRHFKPELLNRLDEIVVFDPLSNEQLRQVARLQMKDVARRLAERGIALAVTDAALDYVLAESYEPVSICLESTLQLFLTRTTTMLAYTEIMRHSLLAIRYMVQGLSEGGSRRKWSLNCPRC